MSKNFFVICRTGKGLYLGYHYNQEVPARDAETFFRERGEDVEFFTSATELWNATVDELIEERHPVFINSGGRNCFDVKQLVAQEQEEYQDGLH